MALKVIRFWVVVFALVGFLWMESREFEDVARWIAYGGAGLVAVMAAARIARSFWRKIYGVNILGIAAIVAALAAGEFLAAIVVALVLATGEMFEVSVRRWVKRRAGKLKKGQPKIVHVIGRNEFEYDEAVDKVAVGDVVMVKTGEWVPVDGVLLAKGAVLSEVNLTGNKEEVECRKGSVIASGMVNLGEDFRMRVVRTAKESQCLQAARMMDEAEVGDVRFVKVADEYAMLFTLLIFVVAGVAWWLSGDHLRFVQVLVVASPVPMIWATPIAFAMGLGRAGRRGVLIRSGVDLEALAEARGIVFDKTNALSGKRVRVDRVVALDGRYNRERIVQMVASVEQGSEYVLARSIVRYAAAHKIKLETPERVVEQAQGVDAVLGGRRVMVGNVGYLMDSGIDVSRLQEAARSCIFVVVDGVVVGFVMFSGSLRQKVRSVIWRVKRLGVKDVVMVTGDTKKAASIAAEKAGVKRFYGACTTESRVIVVRDMVERPVVYVGGGMSDAAAMAEANVGVALAELGTATSRAAGVIVMGGDLERVSEVIEIAQKAKRAARWSVKWGMGVCFVLVGMAAFGLTSAVVGAVLSGVLVDGISLLVARWAR